MASNTENLNLLMKNPSTDGADTFNVQTMLNENWQKIDNNAGKVAQTLANILKPTTPPLIGLPPSTTPDGMFRALGNTGELHVWRKTVTTAQEIPAGYTLGASAAKTLAKSSENSGNSYATFYISSSISVDDAGNVTMNSPATVDIWQGIDVHDSDERAIFGKFIKFYSVSNSDAGITSDLETGIYFIPNSAEFTRYRDGKRSGYTNISACQKVDAYPLTPAGTTTTYPVSTNPNAYQEGSDAKEAGYTLGEVVSGNFQFGYPYSSNTGFRMDASASVSVDDNGNVSLAAPITYKTINKTNVNSKAEIEQLMLGKYVIADKYTYPHSDDIPGGIVIYIPSDATINMDPDAGSWRLSKYQPVTGYAAIPAGTTIEYLGKLGNKARVQVVSYVGTGTYGSSNPNSLTFDFVPKAVFLFSADTYNKCFVAYGDTTGFVFDSDATTVLHVSWNGKNISWFNTDNDLRQHNVSGYKYRAIAIG